MCRRKQFYYCQSAGLLPVVARGRPPSRMDSRATISDALFLAGKSRRHNISEKDQAILCSRKISP